MSTTIGGYATTATSTPGPSSNPWTSVANAEGAPDGVVTQSISPIGGFGFEPTETDLISLGATTITSVPSGSAILAFSWTLFRKDPNGVTTDQNLVISLTDGISTWNLSSSGIGWPTTIGSGQGITGTPGSGGLPNPMITASSSLEFGVQCVATAPVAGTYGEPQVDAGAWSITYGSAPPPSWPYTQNWDGVTAPALPSDFTFNSSSDWATTASPPSGSTSGGNALTTTGGTNDVGVWNAETDQNGGNVTIATEFAVTSTADTFDIGLLARCDSTTPVVGSSGTFYYAYIQTTAFAGQAALVISSQTSGAGGTNYDGPLSFPYAATTWYNFALTCNGNSLSVTLKRLTDGYYLNGAGSWQAAFTPALTAIDGSITGAGYGGFAVTDLSRVVYLDDFSFGNAPDPFSLGLQLTGLRCNTLLRM